VNDAAHNNSVMGTGVTVIASPKISEKENITQGKDAFPFQLSFR
jgi:hypothetical protein